MYKLAIGRLLVSKSVIGPSSLEREIIRIEASPEKTDRQAWLLLVVEPVGHSSIRVLGSKGIDTPVTTTYVSHLIGATNFPPCR